MTLRIKPRPASSAIVRNGDRLLLVRRINPPSKDMFAFPGGRGEEGETPAETALRELHEETGIVARKPQLFAIYDLPSHSTEGVLTSHYFLSVFTVETDADPAVTAADDAADAGWYTLAEIRRLPAPESVIECAERLLA
ncbi:Bifunctional NMN adenylyltransferase/Nudix hydrolase [Rhizobium rhizogenes]|uniref:Bifunctional NMN adenylyltransferase/Nudix hydrolase n=1 Tax=Rhizobium rhizogenes TaxID=359 RepID=A0AAN2DC03_RHIRH|nr:MULTISPECIES: NUDIX domain-containing protein [Rhizobium/Agrobacterium group]AQS62214.1 NUDIX domain-containing protein [Rhizobium rhizogenes]MCZ7442506.1 NUDIX domain-containing protein [Rhizobium rhizogenes]NSZ78499.1 NUDIX domain-containing protein [Agrobacterium tumefaciens]OAM65334.1 ADP-ribose pyrophosphatase [Rhizobium rhizogenes]CAD0210709.1 Bifunctional NMN adenylyltransferase/Nudix hydrolase [Rhizobium rhizogenes]